MAFNSSRLNHLIDKYGDLVERNGENITVFIDEVEIKKGLQTVLIFCKEVDNIDISDTFNINGKLYTIQGFMHHTSNHYELLLERLIIPKQAFPLTIYKSTITFNNCQMTSKQDELLTTNEYTIHTKKAIESSNGQVLSNVINTVITIDYVDSVGVGTILKINGNLLKVKLIDNYKLLNTNLILHCIQITNDKNI